MQSTMIAERLVSSEHLWLRIRRTISTCSWISQLAGHLSRPRVWRYHEDTCSPERLYVSLYPLMRSSRILWSIHLLVWHGWFLFIWLLPILFMDNLLCVSETCLGNLPSSHFPSFQNDALWLSSMNFRQYGSRLQRPNPEIPRHKSVSCLSKHSTTSVMSSIWPNPSFTTWQHVLIWRHLDSIE